MVKVEGPLFSLTARGTFRNAIQFRVSGGKTIAGGAKSAPTSRTTPQTAHTDQVRDMAAAWRQLNSSDRASWNSCGATNGTSGYRLFFREWFLQGVSAPGVPIVPCQ